MSATTEDIKDFIEIKKPIAKTIRKSALFNLIEILLKESHSLINNYPIDKIEKEDRTAYLIKLDEKSHLTIDKVYAEETTEKGLNGFSYVHYTEILKEMVVHVYFNRQGQYLYCQAKLSSGTYLQIEPSFENEIKNNSFVAAELLLNLLNEKAKRYTNAAKKADEIEKSLMKESDKERYIQMAEEFIKYIQEMNTYNELELDCRDVVVSQMVKELQLIKTIQEEESTISAVDETDKKQTSLIETGEIKKPVSKKIMKKQRYFQEIKELEAHLDEMNSKARRLIDRIDVVRNAKTLQIKSLESMSFELDKNERDMISEIDRKIEPMLNVEELFNECILKGRIEEFKVLFTLTRKVDFYFCKELIRLMIGTNNKEIFKGQIAICEFLFENSEVYRQSIILLSDIVIVLPNEGFGFSLLLGAAIQNNWIVFSMLLRHGFNPNGPGVYYDKKFIPTLRAAICFTEEVKYIELLLKHGASINRPRDLVAEDININRKVKGSPKRSISLIKESQSVINSFPIKSDYSLFNRISELTDLILAFNQEKYQFLSYIQEGSNLWEIAKILAKISMLDGFSARFMFPTMGGVFYASGREELEAITFQQKMMRLLNSNNQQMAFIVYPTKDSQWHNMQFEAFKMLCGCFQKKSKEALVNLDHVIDILEVFAKAETNKLEASYFYNACLFVISQKQDLTFMEVKRIVEINCKFAMLHYNSTDPMTKEYLSFVYFRRAIDIATQSSFAEQLKKESIFQVACRTLEKTKYAYKPDVSDQSTTSNALETFKILRFSIPQPQTAATLDQLETQEKPKENINDSSSNTNEKRDDKKNKKKK